MLDRNPIGKHSKCYIPKGRKIAGLPFVVPGTRVISRTITGSRPIWTARPPFLSNLFW